MRQINQIVIHCAATPDGRNNTAADIDQWHQQRGFKRTPEWMGKFNPHLKAIGYHYVIKCDGTLETGRHEGEIGAHAAGNNLRSIGICLMGSSRYSDAQWETLQELVRDLLFRYPGAEVVGHKDLPNVSKACPGFSVAKWQDNHYQPEPGNILV